MGRFIGDANDNLLTGGLGDDYLFGAQGNDTLLGGGGNDLLDGDRGDDIIDGGEGTDRTVLYLLPAPGGVKYTLGDGVVDTTLGKKTLISIEGSDIFGTNFADNITGGSAIDYIWARDGNDLINGGSGNDFLFGEDGNDNLIGGSGGDLVDGGIGNDYLFGDVGNDTLYGGSGDDILDSHYGDDIIDGGPGTDRTVLYLLPAPGGVTYGLGDGAIDTTIGRKTLISIEGADIFGTKFADHITGGSATDYIWARGGNDIVSGGVGKDYLYGEDGNDRLDGGSGDDLIDGSDGDDTLSGGSGNNVLNGGVGTDTADYSATAGVVADLRGGWASTVDSKDIMNSIENLVGSAYSDSLVGSAGVNQLFGGAGDDFLVGGLGSDVVDGDLGSDVAAFYLEPSTQGTYSLRIGTGTDLGKLFVVVTNGTVAETIFNISVVPEGVITVTGLGARSHQGTDQLTGIERLLFTTQAADPYATPTLPGYLTIDVLSGSQITGGIRSQIVLGTSEADSLGGGAGSNALYGFAGDDTFLAGEGQNLIDGGEGRDVVSYLSSAAAVHVDLAAKLVSHANGYDVVIDVEDAWGTSFYDVLVGDGRANFLQGWFGNDRLVGGGGNDTMYGGSGADVFVYNTLSDALPSAPDLLLFSGKWLNVFDPQKGKYVKVAGEGDKIDLSAVDADTLTLGDQAFTLSQKFTGVAGQMYTNYDVSTDTTSLFLDVNGDRAADMVIRLIGQVSLSGADFVL